MQQTKTFNRDETDFYQLRRLLQNNEFPYLNEEKFGVTREECINYLYNLKAPGEQYFVKIKERLFRYLLIAFWLTIGIMFASIVYFLSVKHPKINFFVVILPVYGCLFLVIYLMRRVQNMKKLPAFYQRRAPVPVIREDVEQLLTDYMTKRDIWEHGTEQEKDAVCQEYDPGFYGFRDALFEEIQHPSEDCALADVKFGMTLEELYQTNTLKGLQQSEQPSLNSIRSMLVGEMVGYGNPFVSFHLRNGKLAEVSIEYFELVRNLFRMDEETAEQECQKVIDFISNNLQRFYGPTCTVGKKYFDIVYSQFERPKVFIRHLDYSL